MSSYLNIAKFRILSGHPGHKLWRKLFDPSRFHGDNRSHIGLLSFDHFMVQNPFWRQTEGE